MGVKFCVEKSIKGRLHTKAHPINAGWRCGPKTENFSKFRHINAPQVHIPWAIFTKFSTFLGSFMDGCNLGRFAQEIMELWVFNLGVCVLP